MKEDYHIGTVERSKTYFGINYDAYLKSINLHTKYGGQNQSKLPSNRTPRSRQKKIQLHPVQDTIWVNKYINVYIFQYEIIIEHELRPQQNC